MNEAAKVYWRSFWKEESDPPFVSAWSFDASVDELAQPVVDGLKTAICSGLIFYQIEQEQLPEKGNYGIVLNRLEEPVAFISNNRCAGYSYE